MNKWSNNVIARHVLATLGATAEPGRIPWPAGVGGRTSLRGPASTSGFVIENGAGLSRSAWINARSLGQLLVSAWRSRRCRAGGLAADRRRRRHRPPAPRQQPRRRPCPRQTGTLDGVRSLAGYVLAHDGQRYAVVLMINHPNAGATRDAQDALLEWVAEVTAPEVPLRHFHPRGRRSAWDGPARSCVDGPGSAATRYFPPRGSRAFPRDGPGAILLRRRPPRSATTRVRPSPRGRRDGGGDGPRARGPRAAPFGLDGGMEARAGRAPS